MEIQLTSRNRGRRPSAMNGGRCPSDSHFSLAFLPSTLHHNPGFFLFLFLFQSAVIRLSSMGRHGPPPNGLWEKAVAKGYEPGAHRAGDSKRDAKGYRPKTVKDHNGALKRYEE